MYETPKNCIEFKLWGRYALFTDPLTKVGGEKCSYHIPTYEALKGVCKSIYWKPTIIWIVDAVRVMNRIRTQTKGTKPLNFNGIYPSERNLSKKKEEPINTLSIYTFLSEVEYQVRAHFEWNVYQTELKKDRVDGKHFDIAKRMLERGGRQDIYLGTRDCQGYVEPCKFGENMGAYDSDDEISYSLMFHGFDYPDETGKEELVAKFWRPVMRKGVITFEHPDSTEKILRKFVRPMTAKLFGVGVNVKSVETEALEMGVKE